MMVLATNPVWMIKTRMQLQDKKAESGGVLLSKVAPKLLRRMPVFLFVVS
ncbi:unnamed protein product [Ectocarpus sp. CCAP 1310/34]|nr:unnamed protein product [Ectocarpus sp. CCAP 1310/34]